MDAILTKLLEQLNSSVFILLIVLGGMMYLLYKTGGWVEKFKTHEQRIEEANGLKDRVIEIKTKIDLIYQNTNPNPLFRAHSPLSLTEKGEEVAKSVSADTILESYYEKLVHAVDENNPKNAYDIQQASLTVAKDRLRKLLNERELVAIKDEAFKRGVLLEDILGIFGILLRNRILLDRDISIAEVDMHDTTKQSPT